MMKTTIWPENDATFQLKSDCSFPIEIENTHEYNGQPGYLYGGIAPFDETVVTLAVPFAAGATAGLFVLFVELSVLGCTVGATAYDKSIKKKNNQ